MGLNLGLIITMGSVSVGGAIVERILGKIGKIDEANLVGVVTQTMLIGTVVTGVVTALNEVRKLSGK